MRFIHLADLHIGKRVNGFSMLEDQKYILEKIIAVIDEEKPQAVLIAGDVYDRTIPAEEAVKLFDDFLVRLAERKLEVYIISGNHDSAERVAFGARLMENSGIHVSPVYYGQILPLTFEDEYGFIDFWLFPFLKPINVRRFYPDEKIETYNDAMKVVVKNLALDTKKRNVALVHQFITGAAVCDSEQHSVGGIDEISAEVFEDFDYVALGHLHSPQRVGKETVRYAGSPLKYSFSEAKQKKAVTAVDLLEKGQTKLREIPLYAKRDMRRICGSFDEIMSKTPCEAERNDYYEITLTDENNVMEAMNRLRAKYPNIMTLCYDNKRTRAESEILVSTAIDQKSPLDLFAELFEQQNAQPMNRTQRYYINSLIAKIWEEEV